jgi:hypothetical protein
MDGYNARRIPHMAIFLQPCWASSYARWLFLDANFLELRYGEVQHSPAPISQTLSTARRDGIGGACDDHQGDDQHDGRHDHHDHDHDGHHERGVNKGKRKGRDFERRSPGPRYSNSLLLLGHAPFSQATALS